MKQLSIISFGSPSQEEIDQFERRTAARAIVFDADKNIAMLFVSKEGYHKLPGGGVDEGESLQDALHRECMEEIGCSIKIEREVGSIVEYRTQWNLHQESFCWIAKLVGGKGLPHLTEEEIAAGFFVEWMPLARAIDLISNEKPIVYEGTFIAKRDLLFLQEAARLLS